MKILIDIPEELYVEIMSRKYSRTKIEKAVTEGTVISETQEGGNYADILSDTQNGLDPVTIGVVSGLRRGIE